MEAKIIYETDHYQVVDARAWKMGFTVDKYLPECKGYTTVKDNMTKADAIKLADGLEKLIAK